MDYVIVHGVATKGPGGPVSRVGYVAHERSMESVPRDERGLELDMALRRKGWVLVRQGFDVDYINEEEHDRLIAIGRRCWLTPILGASGLTT